MAMRWEALFGDLDAQASASERFDLETEISERARVEIAGIGLFDRLRSSVGTRVSVLLRQQLRFDGVLAGVGQEWILLEVETRSVLIPLGSVLLLDGLSPYAFGPAAPLRRSFGSVLRLLARDRAMATIYLNHSDTQQSAISGVIDRVGRDHCDVTTTRDGAARRAINVSGRQTMPFYAIAAVLSAASERR